MYSITIVCFSRSRAAKSPRPCNNKALLNDYSRHYSSITFCYTIIKNVELPLAENELCTDNVNTYSIVDCLLSIFSGEYERYWVLIGWRSYCLRHIMAAWKYWGKYSWLVCLYDDIRKQSVYARPVSRSILHANFSFILWLLLGYCRKLTV